MKTNKKTVKKVAKETIKKVLTPIEEKRVAILKDALKQIKIEAFLPMSCNGYVRGGIHNEINELVEENAGKTVELKKFIDTLVNPKKPCEICARGALLLSSIRKFNNFTLKEAECEGLDEQAIDRTAEIFGKENANLMESYFEKNIYELEDENYYEWENLNDTNRVIRIFNNAIRNKGIFKPKQEKF